MAWGTFNFRSEALNMPVEAEVLIPQPGYKTLTQTEGYKVIVLLHGANNDRTEWLLKSQIMDMVKELPVLVFMPSGKNSFYINTYNGYRYMDFIAEEIPAFIKHHFRVSDKKEGWLIAGESMGGYGAVVCGLHHTGTFGNIACFSGALDVLEREMQLPTVKMENVFGPDREKVRRSFYNPFILAESVPAGERPKLFLCCGDEDSLYDVNRRFYYRFRESYEITARWGRGAHEFQYWNERLKEMFVWFCKNDIQGGQFMGRCGDDFCKA